MGGCLLTLFVGPWNSIKKYANPWLILLIKKKTDNNLTFKLIIYLPVRHSFSASPCENLIGLLILSEYAERDTFTDIQTVNFPTFQLQSHKSLQRETKMFSKSCNFVLFHDRKVFTCHCWENRWNFFFSAEVTHLQWPERTRQLAGVQQALPAVECS